MIALGIVALLIALWSFGAAQASWRRSFRLETRLAALEGREEATETVQEVQTVLGAQVSEEPEDNGLMHGGYCCSICNSWLMEAKLATKVDLEIPFLDEKLPVQIYLCERCVEYFAQTQHP